jgi:hypothetical protein
MGNTLSRLIVLGGLPLGEHTCTGTSLKLKIPIVIKLYSELVLQLNSLVYMFVAPISIRIPIHGPGRSSSKISKKKEDKPKYLQTINEIIG